MKTLVVVVLACLVCVVAGCFTTHRAAGDASPAGDGAGADHSGADANSDLAGQDLGPGVTGTATLAPNVSLVAPETASSLTIEDDQILVGPDAAAWALGLAPKTILVSDHGSGLLRQVLSVSQEAEGVVVKTTAARMEDLFSQADFSIKHVGGEAPAHAKADTQTTSLLYQELDGLVLYEGQVSGVDLSIKIPYGALWFDPSITFDYVKSGMFVHYINFQITGNLSIDADVEIRFSGAIRDHEKKDPTPFEPSISIPIVGKKFTFMVAGVPVVMEPNLSVDLGLGVFIGSDPYGPETVVKTRLWMNYPLTTTVEFTSDDLREDDSGWQMTDVGKPVFDVQEFEIEGPQVWWGVLKPFMHLDMGLRFYGWVGPYFKLGPYRDYLYSSLNKDGMDYWKDDMLYMGIWDVEPGCTSGHRDGVEGLVGVKAEALGWTIGDAEWPAFTFPVDDWTWNEACGCKIVELSARLIDEIDPAYIACRESTSSYRVQGQYCTAQKALYQCEIDYLGQVQAALEQSECNVLPWGYVSVPHEADIITDPTTQANLQCLTACLVGWQGCYDDYAPNDPVCGQAPDDSCLIGIADITSCYCQCPDWPWTEPCG